MKKAELKKIMKRAWTIKKENTENIFSLCLKMAWAEFKRPTRKGGRMMNVQNIKKGFYTDGEKIFSKVMGVVCVWNPAHEENDLWMKAGNEPSRYHDDLEVSKVKPGMEFCNGEIKVLDKNTIEVLRVAPINAVSNKKDYCVKFDGYKNYRQTVTA